MATKTVIGVWPDTQGERNPDGSPRWIVSLDEIDEHDQAEATQTLTVRATKDKAMIYARAAAGSRLLSIRAWVGGEVDGHYEDVD